MPRVEKSLLLQVVVATVVLLVEIPAYGQQFVDAPEPKMESSSAMSPIIIEPRPVRTHNFFDRQNVIAFSVAASMRAADTAYTCAVGVGTTTHNADGSITVHREDLMTVNSCHGVALLNTAFTGMGLTGSYLLHRMGWHKLERIPNWIVATVPALGIAYTATHQNLHAGGLAGR